MNTYEIGLGFKSKIGKDISKLTGSKTKIYSE